MSGAGRDNLRFIQGVRGLAALAVVLYHARVYVDGPAYLHAGRRMFEGGAAGVDLFFVVSGFIMVYTTSTLRGSLRDTGRFLVRRIVRVWPVYAVAYVAVCLLAFPSGHPDFQPSLRDAAHALTFMPRDAGGTAPYFGAPILDVGWTLNYEILFYGVFAATLLAPRRARPCVLLALIAACTVALPWMLAGGVQMDGMTGYGVAGYASLLTSPLLWEFGAGAAIGHLYLSRWSLKDRDVATCLAALTGALFLWMLLSGYRRGHGPIHWGLPAALFVLTLALRDKITPWRVPPALVWLGDVSFSLYLLHRLPQVVGRLYPHEALTTGGGFFAFTLVTGVVLAYAGNRWLERGLSEWLRRKLLRPVVSAPLAEHLGPTFGAAGRGSLAEADVQQGVAHR
ncbi:MAG: acyltransferase [Myxococcales bacterium]|nr:acyltransferase [Myxococcales bacterium]MBP6844722.1 acyltransferase [Kofleriaceae bacterium]